MRRLVPHATRPVTAGGVVPLVGATIVGMVRLRVAFLLTIGGTAALLAGAAVWHFAAGARRTALAFLAAASVAAGLCSAEALMDLMHRPWIKETFTVPLTAPDSLLGTMTRGGIATRNQRFPRQLGYCQEFDVVYRTEADSARAVPGRPVEGPAIALIGDSFLFGEGLEDDETIAGRLQVLLPWARVYNYGVRGHGTAQNWLLLRRVLAARSDVRACIVTFIIDDMRCTVAPASLLASELGARRASGARKR